ncbi:hypothetical protein [Aquirufa regiilacus]|uniref:QacE n=1 Tax=Aquirufa regiilacus TaxID=3024868 RepID=A0ABU3TQ82_9BACT|nr:hypothetical protein [Aquirufa sp. LEOWEIH-7C]MDU0808028.1 hypothetical protein [Aquirufa sp. LEOWEIH-7C]
MENVVSNFESPEISIKLTDEKLYIKTLSSSETFALRSINGIGIVDLIDKYNVELTAQKNAKKPTGLYILGGFLLLAGIGNIAVSIGPALIFIILGGAVFYWASTQQAPEPTLKSAVRIMISGMNRDFEFDKSGPYVNQIAQFIVKIEETLTAYQKNNN